LNSLWGKINAISKPKSLLVIKQVRHLRLMELQSGICFSLNEPIFSQQCGRRQALSISEKNSFNLSYISLNWACMRVLIQAKVLDYSDISNLKGGVSISS